MHICWTCVLEFQKERQLQRHRASAEHLRCDISLRVREPAPSDSELDQKRIALFERATGLIYEDTTQLRRHGKKYVRLYFCRCVFDWGPQQCNVCLEKNGYLTDEDKKTLTQQIYADAVREKEEEAESRRRRSALKLANMAAISEPPQKVRVEDKSFQDVSLLQRIRRKVDAVMEHFSTTPEDRRRRSPLKKSSERAKVRTISSYFKIPR